MIMMYQYRELDTCKNKVPKDNYKNKPPGPSGEAKEAWWKKTKQTEHQSLAFVSTKLCFVHGFGLRYHRLTQTFVLNV